MADYRGTMISLSHSQQPRERQSSSEEEDENSKTKLVKFNNKAAGGGGGSPGASASASEVMKKPRGRPPGSKNKPKPPIVITKDNDKSMQPLVLEVPIGSDIIEMLLQFSHKRSLCLSILSASGFVSNVTLRHPTLPGTLLSVSGRFQILSLQGSFVPPCVTSLSSSSAPHFPLSISLAGGQGQVVGGLLAGKLVAVSPVVLVVASFVNPLFHKLSFQQKEAAAEEEAEEEQANVVAVEGNKNVAAPTPLNCHIPSSHDVLSWAPPTSHPSHHHY